MRSTPDARRLTVTTCPTRRPSFRPSPATSDAGTPFAARPLQVSRAARRAARARTPSRAACSVPCSCRRAAWRSRRRSRARARRRRPRASAPRRPCRSGRRSAPAPRPAIPQPSSSTSITIRPDSSPRARSSIASCARVYLTAFSSSASRAVRSRSRSTSSRTRLQRSEPPGARRDLRPAHEDVLEERLEFDLLDAQEVRLVGGGEHQQALDDRVDAGQLVERDVDLAVLRPREHGPSPGGRVAIVTGVRSSCEASWMKRSWRSSSDRRSSARCSAIRSASTRRRACHTIARNSAADQRDGQEAVPRVDAVGWPASSIGVAGQRRSRTPARPASRAAARAGTRRRA